MNVYMHSRHVQAILQIDDRVLSVSSLGNHFHPALVLKLHLSLHLLDMISGRHGLHPNELLGVTIHVMIGLGIAEVYIFVAFGITFAEYHLP